ncbi:MAG: holo-ACP synthase [Rhodocyclaceae bacterium]|jgi:holo-[acyl-carrier protein] synthase|nr:holo-ACP synthase [Rhodocyclaceae bacterium]
MIHGIGTDLVKVSRIESSLQRFGVRFAERILAPDERSAFAAHADPVRFLAKRFAAKEAFGKALGTGVAVPATLHAISVTHDARGRPGFRYAARLAEHMACHGLSAHLSLSDELDYVVAFAVVERTHSIEGSDCSELS